MYGKYGSSSNSGENGDLVKKASEKKHDYSERRSNLLCRMLL